MRRGVLRLSVASILSDGATESPLFSGMEVGVFLSPPHVSPCLAQSLPAILAQVVLCRCVHPVLNSFLSWGDRGKL